MTQVWYVQGDEDDTYFATKMDAEIHARVLFPNEDVDRRYGRVFYRAVHKYVSTPEDGLQLKEQAS